MTWTVPNILTFARVVAAPCVALVFLVFDRPLADRLAFGLFVAAAVTDFFDGWLARRLNQISGVGKMLDPIADKAMVIIALFALFVPALIAGPAVMPDDPKPDSAAAAALLAVPAVLIVLREILISGLREYLGEVKLPVSFLAKAKTTVQMIAIGGLLLVNALKWSVRPAAEDAFRSAGKTLREAPGAAGLVSILEPLALGLLWIAALLTVITGWDYFRRGMAYIREREDG